MDVLKNKYVLHIPACKCVGGNLEPLDIGEILDGLYRELERNGIDSFYVTKVEGHYLSRAFDEVLVTVFASSAAVDEIFRQWFNQNNHILCQEAFSYEHANRMVVEKLKKV